MSLAISLYRGHAHPTDGVERWLRQRGWRQQHNAGRVALWTHDAICRDTCDTSEALIRTALHEAQKGVTFTDDWRGVDPPERMELERYETREPRGGVPPRPRGTRKERMASKPGKGEELFE